MANVTIIHESSKRNRITNVTKKCECFECQRKQGITPKRQTNVRATRFRSHSGREAYVFENGGYVKVPLRDLDTYLAAQEAAKRPVLSDDDNGDLVKAAAELGIDLTLLREQNASSNA